MGLVFTVKAFAVASLGGFANPLGVLVGAIVFGVVESFSNYINSAFGDLYPLLLVYGPARHQAERSVRRGQSRCPLTEQASPWLRNGALPGDGSGDCRLPSPGRQRVPHSHRTNPVLHHRSP